MKMGKSKVPIPIYKMEPKQIIHLYGPSVCLWSLQRRDFNIFQEKEFIKSPLYCAKEAANLQWFFLLEKSGENNYNCILRMRKCIHENLPLPLILCVAGAINSKDKEILVDLTTTYKPRIQFRLKNVRYYDAINIYVTTNIAEKPITFFNNEFFFLNEKFSDFVFIVKKNRYPAHKMILAANSPVFRAMFSCEMKEKFLNHVEIKDFEPELIQEFLCFLYKGDISNWKDFARRLFEVAHKYEVNSLKNECELSLEKNLSLKNVIDLLVFSEHYTIEGLKKKCIFLINKEFERIREQENYQNLQKIHPHLLKDIFNSANDTVQEEPKSVVRLSNIKDVIVQSGVNTINNIDSIDGWIFEFPEFEREEFFWTFRIYRSVYKIDISLCKKNKLGLHVTNNSVKFKIVVQNAERVIVEVNIEDEKNEYQLIELNEIRPNFTIFWEVESIYKADKIQKSNDIRHSLIYEFLFINPYLSDINFHSEGKRFPAHKLILYNKSAGFKNNFLSGKEFQEKLSNIQVDDIKPKVFEELLKFIYMGIVDNLNNIAADLFVAAKKYEMQDLQLMCENALRKNLDSKNVISTLIFADKHNVDCLKDECIFLIINESVRLEETLESSEKLDPRTLMEIIDALHTGKRPMMINLNRDVSSLITRTFKEILCILGQEILNASFASVKTETISKKISILGIKLILFQFLGLPNMTTITALASTLEKKASLIYWKLRPLVPDCEAEFD